MQQADDSPANEDPAFVLHRGRERDDRRQPIGSLEVGEPIAVELLIQRGDLNEHTRQVGRKAQQAKRAASKRHF